MFVRRADGSVNGDDATRAPEEFGARGSTTELQVNTITLEQEVQQLSCRSAQSL